MNTAQKANPSETVSKPFLNQKQEQEQEQEQKQEQEKVKSAVGMNPDGSESPDKKATDSETIEKIFDYWRQTMDSPKSQLDAKRKEVIRRALKAGHSPRDLCRAIQGCSLTPHNQGQNERGQKYLGIHVCLKDADQIDPLHCKRCKPADIASKEQSASRKASSLTLPPQSSPRAWQQIGNNRPGGRRLYAADDGNTFDME